MIRTRTSILRRVAIAATVCAIGCGDKNDVVKAEPVGGIESTEPSVTLTVGAAGIRIDGKPLDPTRLQGILAARPQSRSKQPVGVIVEPKTPFSSVSTVIDQTLIAGVESIQFSMGTDTATVKRPRATNERTPLKPMLLVLADKVSLQLAGEQVAEYPLAQSRFDAAALTAQIEKMPADARKSMTVVVEPTVLFEPVMAALVASGPIGTIAFGTLGTRSSVPTPAPQVTSDPPGP